MDEQPRAEQQDCLKTKLRQGQNADDAADARRYKHGREQIQDALDEQQGAFTGQPFPDGTEHAEAADAEQHGHNGELIAEHCFRDGVAFSSRAGTDRPP